MSRLLISCDDRQAACPASFQTREERIYMKLLSQSTLRFLAAHGAEAAAADRKVVNPVLLLRALEQAFPAENASPCAPETAAYLEVLTDLLSCMDERLYEHYRPVEDLFRKLILGMPGSSFPDTAVWREALLKGEQLGLLDPEELRRLPHKN